MIFKSPANLRRNLSAVVTSENFEETFPWPVIRLIKQI
jgi:hypothetical protein